MGIFDRFRSTRQTIIDRNGLKADPSEPDATRLVEEGHVFEANGQFDKAMQRYLEAIQIAPNPARAYLNLGNVLLLKSDLPGALDAFRMAIKHKPNYAGAYYNIGNALLSNEQYIPAVENYRMALEIQPDYAEAHCALGIALQRLEQFEGAVECFKKALGVNPHLAEAHTNLNNALNELYNVGNVLANNGQLDAAAASYRSVLEINPNHVAAHCNLGLALQKLGYLEDAVASFRHMLMIQPDLLEAHFNLGSALHELRQFEDAVTCYRRAIEIKPDFVEAHYNIGSALQNLGKIEDAMASTRRALEIKPDLTSARSNLGMLLLARGRYIEAWPEYEFRFDPQSVPPNFPFPKWQGESLTGKSIVVWPEQGLGDEIQFARYFSLLASRGVSHLTVVCKPPLKALFEGMAEVDIVLTDAEANSLPPHDYWIFALSLPLRFATTVDTIPSKLPYLHAPSKRLTQWRDRLPSDGFKIGLVWKGNTSPNPDRSLSSLSALSPLWSVPGITFISLQKGPGEDEAAIPLAGQPLLHLGSDIQDLADTAAIVAQLDLVICIDTSTAHLAGALNKSCWVLLPAIGLDWRWFDGRTDSPWYPGVMRLFHQTKIGDWTETVGEITQALKIWVNEHAE